MNQPTEPINEKNLLGDFLVSKKLGEGGMGTVYKARQLSMDREVALKVLSKQLAKDPKLVARFQSEARAAGKLDHPNIVHGIAIGEERGLHYFAMEFIHGQTLDKVLEERGKLSLSDALHITVQVARALDYAHSRKLVHRDIKPENIMITDKGNVKLADLGLAKLLDEDLGITQAGSGFGTPYYMPPEQARSAKDVDHRCDIYALGVTLYQMLTGKLPYEGETTLEVMTAKVDSTHKPARLFNDDVPELIDLMLDKMMAPEPTQRYQSSTSLIQAIDQYGLAGDVLEFPHTPVQPRRPPKTTTPPNVLPQENTSEEADEEADEKADQKANLPSDDSLPDIKDRYFLRYKDGRGKQVRKRGDRHQIRELLRRGVVGGEGEAARNIDGPYRPLLSYPEFSDIAKSRIIKQKGDAAFGGTGNRFEQLARERDQLRKRRRMKRSFSSVLVYVFLLGVLGAGGYLGWKYFIET